MTTHDERATAAPTQTVDPEFSNTPTEAPRLPDDSPAESDQQVVDDASPQANAEQTQAGEVAPTPDAQPSGDQLLFATDPYGLRSRWDEIQAAFVDDPADCVHKADALVEEVVEQLTAGFTEARSRLEAQWARGEHASTEDLRVALQRYREFFQRLLAV